MGIQTEIHVGILFAPKVSFFLHGNYVLEQTGKEVSGAGLLEASPKGSYLLTIEGNTAEATLPLILRPVNEELAFFDLKDVTIGINFHWERMEDQRFTGSLKVIAEEDHLTAINILPMEDYLKSVISSEMKATAFEEFLKAHAVISRSWLLAQIEKARKLKDAGKREAGNDDFSANSNSAPGGIRPGDLQQTTAAADVSVNAGGIAEHIRWYDREDHHHFDVCADDHCQRYQGITRATTEEVSKAVDETSGEVLSYEGTICDARYSKCCGGISEVFENVWEPVNHPYLTKVIDNANAKTDKDTRLNTEEKARAWITNSPAAFCNTTNKEVLSQVLNDYDMETADFFRWQVMYDQQMLQKLLKSRLNIDVGDILALTPVERGVSGRLVRLKIQGSKNSIIIGKELEIRKAFSKTHLYSSAFVVDHKDLRDGIPQKFIFTGAGWGHGVGLCQIGAAVMGAGNYSYTEILAHYFKGAAVEKIY